MYRVAGVAVEGAALPYDKVYSYRIPVELEGAVCTGCRVAVPFGNGNRRRTGVVLEVREEEPEKLKPLLELLDREPLVDGEGMALMRFLKERTFCTWFDALRLLIPAGAGIAYRTVYGPGGKDPDLVPLSPLQKEIAAYVHSRKKPVEESVLGKEFSPGEKDLGELVDQGILVRGELHRQRILDDKICMVRLREDWTPAKLTPKQSQVYRFLEENEAASLKEICYYTGVTRGVADALKSKGAVEYYDEIRARNPYQGAAAVEEIPRLSPEQQEACESLAKLLEEERPRPALLYGVTGSGKTQVFLQLIRRVLDRGRQVIVMVPEISLTAQAVQSFHQRFGSRVAVLHSGLSLGERMDEWRRIRRGEADIVVGTRSAAFAPLGRLGLVVMDEEQEGAYQSEKSPRYHAREVALFRCARHKALLVLSSATPSVETYHRAEQGKYALVALHQRFGSARLPDVYTVDMREAENLSVLPSLSGLLLDGLRHNLEAGEQSILLLNRRGYSTVVKCSSCGTVADCPHCSVALTFHSANGSLMCHYCGYSQPRATSCSHCGSGLVRYSGVGTQKLEEELKELLPGARLLRVDMDTTMSKFSHERLFGSFSAGEYDIMIGTQMVAKGLNFPRVTLVGVLCADQALYGGDFRGTERAFSLLTQVVGRSGRGDARGRAVIQTYTPENPVFRLAAEQDYPAFFRQEITSRKIHLYPPFCSMAGIGFVGEDPEEVRKAAEGYLAHFRQAAAQDYPGLPLRLLGPAPFDTWKAAGKYRYKLILKSRGDAPTRKLLGEMAAWFLGSHKGISLFMDMHYDRI